VLQHGGVVILAERDEADRAHDHTHESDGDRADEAELALADALQERGHRHASE
jgi:hypothetical protein